MHVEKGLIPLCLSVRQHCQFFQECRRNLNMTMAKMDVLYSKNGCTEQMIICWSQHKSKGRCPLALALVGNQHVFLGRMLCCLSACALDKHADQKKTATVENGH